VLELPNRKVAIIGGSMAGLFAAIFLRRRGFSVDVYERADGLSDRGAGIATHQPLHDALAAAEVVRPDGTGALSELTTWIRS
jgi:2-polyprenyl-6-methoxyphenol hydroxylase-like FAD-dependent oxidoreductase